MKNGLYSFQRPPSLAPEFLADIPSIFQLQQASKGTIFPPSSSLPQGHRRPVWPGVPAPFLPKDAVSLKKKDSNSCLYLEWGMRAKKREGGGTADAADFVFPLPLPFQPGMPL